MFNHFALLELEARTNNDKDILGVITDSYIEDGKHFIVLDDEWEQAMTSVEVVIDICSGSQFVRVKE